MISFFYISFASCLVALNAMALSSDLENAFFAGQDLFSSDRFTEIYHQHPSLLIDKKTNPGFYVKLRNEINKELQSYMHSADPLVQSFIAWMQGRIDQEAPLAYNDKVYTAFCGHSTEPLSSLENHFLGFDSWRTCTVPQVILADSAQYLPFGLTDFETISRANHLLIDPNDDPLLIPESEISVIGLIPLIRLGLQNIYPIAFATGRAHGIDFSSKGFGLHDYDHFEASTYFSNLRAYYQDLPDNEALMRKTHQHLVDFTQYHADRILSSSTEESMQSRRIIVALFLVLHEIQHSLSHSEQLGSLVQDLINILGLNTAFSFDDFMDVYLPTSPIDGHLLISLDDVKTNLEEYYLESMKSSIESISISEDGCYILVIFQNGRRDLYPTNHHFYFETEDDEELLRCAGIKHQRPKIDVTLDHMEAYRVFQNYKIELEDQVNTLLNELRDVLMNYQSFSDEGPCGKTQSDSFVKFHD